ncbi:hypothetical protein PHET_10689 [Paragonimus heterotremus]|uniref:Uncharacterized protein n=1 Tax=Paragonimus heterotremus TaxID=100268 RepID=A0A8J4T2I8_9TREM|nr:hypothetical protein PHET_10689 [Paragonimus heterotremus]
MPPRVSRSLVENHKRRRYVRGRAKWKLSTNNSQNGNQRKSFRATGKKLIPPKINQPQDFSANELPNSDNSPNQLPPTGLPINGQQWNQRISHGSNDILYKLRNGIARKSEDMADKMSRLAAPNVPSLSPSTTTTTPTSTTPTTTTPTTTSSASSAQSSPRPQASPQFRKMNAGKLSVPTTPKNSPLLSQGSTPEISTPSSRRTTPKASTSKQSGLGTLQPTGLGSIARTLQPKSGKPLESTSVKPGSKLSPKGSLQVSSPNHMWLNIVWIK